jgi:hypothetical protein
MRPPRGRRVWIAAVLSVFVASLATVGAAAASGPTSTHIQAVLTRTAYVTKSGPSTTVRLTTGGGRVTTSTSGDYVRLSRSSMGWAFAGWQFTLPPAISYTSVDFQVYAKTRLIDGPNGFGMQDFSICRYSVSWNAVCMSPWTNIGNASATTAWFSVHGSTLFNRVGRYVRGGVGSNAGTIDIYAVRVKVVYQVLA